MTQGTITRDGYIELFQREACSLVPYDDGKFKSGPRKGEKKWSQGGGSQWNYTLGREVRPDDPPITVEEAVAWIKAAVAYPSAN